MTVTTESGGRQNAFPNETRPYIDESVSYEGYPQNAEKVNGRWAMIGLVALLGCICYNWTNYSRYFLMDTSHPYWKYAEMVNGRLAMLGLIIGTINYVLFGEIAPGFF